MMTRLSYTLKDARNRNGWLTFENNARDDAIIETLDADYNDIESVNNLDVNNTMRCGKHVKNCILQNVFKIYNW